MYIQYNISELSMFTCVCVCMFVGSCLATKVFIGKFAGYEKGVGHHKVDH